MTSYSSKYKYNYHYNKILNKNSRKPLENFKVCGRARLIDNINCQINQCH